MNVGDHAKDFCLKDASNKTHCLKDFKGKRVVLYFYPKDDTPGCTLEAIDFSALKNEFEKENSVIIGISKDSCESHQKFLDKHNLTIILLSDENAVLQKEYGVWKPKKFMGREFMGTVRTTFLIDEKGIVLQKWDSVKVKSHAQDVLNYLKTYK